VALTNATAVLTDDGDTALLIGGEDGAGQPVGVYAVDMDALTSGFVSATLESAGSLDQVHSVGAVAEAGGEVLAFGGIDLNGLASATVYSRKNGTWSESDENQEFARSHTTGLLLTGGEKVFVGGLDEFGEPGRTLQIEVSASGKATIEDGLAIDEWLIAGLGASTAWSPDQSNSLIFPGILPGFQGPYAPGSYWRVSGQADGTAKVNRYEATLENEAISGTRYLTISSATFGTSDTQIFAYGFLTDLSSELPSGPPLSYGLFELDLVTRDWELVLAADAGPGPLNGAEIVYDPPSGKLFIIGGIEVDQSGAVFPTSSIWSIDPLTMESEQVYGQVPSLTALPWGVVETWHNESARTLVLAFARGGADYALSVFNLDDYTFQELHNNGIPTLNPLVPIRLSILDAGHQALLLYPDENGAPLARYLHADFGAITNKEHVVSTVDAFRNNGTYFFSKGLDAGLYVGGVFLTDGSLPTRGLAIELNCLF
jgi:hypothetical protein